MQILEFNCLSLVSIMKQDPPDFKKQWTIRRERSHYQEQEHGLLQYFDPLTSEYFQYHELTDTYS